MSEAWLYAGVTAAVAAVVTAAVWRPRPAQWVPLLVGPLIAAGAAAASVSSGLGLMALLVVPYTYLLVAAALPWERGWARWGVPGIVVAGCLVLAAPASASPLVRVLLAAPFAIGVLALFRAAHARAGDEDIRRERDRRRFGYNGATSPAPAPVIERAVVAVATVQGLAGIAVIGLGLWFAAIEYRYPKTGAWAGFGYAIAAFFGTLGVVIAAIFLGLASGLHRQFDEFHVVFVVMQVLVAVLLLLSHGDWWTAPGVAWTLSTAALAMFFGFAPQPPAETSGNAAEREGAPAADSALARNFVISAAR